jgi:TonB family protein
MKALQFLFLAVIFPACVVAQQIAVRAAPVSQQPVANPKTPQEFFTRARQLSDLEAAGIPFHLKATYVASGDTEFTGNGTYEEWWQSKDVWRKEATLGNFTWVQIKNGAEPALYTSSVYIPLRLRQAVSAMEISTIRDPGTRSNWQLRNIKLGSDSLVVWSSSQGQETNYSTPMTVQYCFTSNGLLQIRKLGQESTLYQTFLPFQTLLIPHNVEVDLADKPVLKISLEILEPLTLTGVAASNLSLPENLNPATGMIQTDMKATAAQVLHVPQPKYPREAKLLGMQGTVVINATIDVSGRIREPYILVSAGHPLDKSTLKTVRQWRYKPTMIDGKPIMEDTHLSVKFSLIN